jgi:YjbE family integral membrane protein
MESAWIVLQILLLNIVLSADNAIVIAMASRRLPQKQRTLTIWLGTAIAIVLRIGFTFIAVQLLKWSFLQLVGACLLFWIAIQLFLERREAATVTQTSDMFKAVWLILSADVIMSLDNVLAIAAVADQRFSYILLGIGMSIPLMVWGSQWLVRLIERYPWLNKIGALILFYTAGEMLLAGLR